VFSFFVNAQSTNFVIWGGNTAPIKVGSNYQFWGAQWDKQVKQGKYSSNASFKGYANTVNAPGWSTNPGNSSGPPASISSYIKVIISSQITKTGSTISGNIIGYAIIKVDSPAGYASDPGHPGTGVVIAVLPV
jgi:hypothetical protein